MTDVLGRLLITDHPAPPVPLADNFADAIVLVGASGSYGRGIIDDLTVEDGEPTGSNIGNGIHQTCWFKWVAPADGTATFDTRGSLATDGNGGPDIPPDDPALPSLDTTLAVWTGTELGDLVEVESNDDDDSGDWGYNSLATFAATSGETYWIQIGTYDEPYTGTLVVNWSLV